MKKYLFIAIACIMALNVNFDASAQTSSKADSEKTSSVKKNNKKCKYIGYTFDQLFEKGTTKADVHKRLGSRMGIQYKADYENGGRIENKDELYFGSVSHKIRIKKGLVYSDPSGWDDDKYYKIEENLGKAVILKSGGKYYIISAPYGISKNMRKKFTDAVGPLDSENYRKKSK